jgi:hypothetical protein
MTLDSTNSLQMSEVGLLLGQQRPESRPLLLGFDAFGAVAMALFVVLDFAPGGHWLIMSVLLHRAELIHDSAN